MCGISGIVGRLDQRNREALARMHGALKHRGPDGEGVWETTPDARGWGAILAHRRLAILDLSPAGAQPMTDAVTGETMVFNGEIYNYVALRDRLTAAGQRFESSGDSQVMLRALGLHGPDALRWLRGMFAVARWNPKTRRLLLARDPLGIKPLYVARPADPEAAGWSLAFASEVRALVASGLLGTPRLSPAAVASVVWNGYVVGPGTAVEGVEMLWPGRAVEVDARGAEVWAEDFWRIPERPPAADMTEARLGELVEESVRLHLASDVPLAVFLSGGVDSSAVANIARKVSPMPVHTFTLAFEEQELNEGPIARRIAAAIGTEHREIVLTEDGFRGELDAAIDGIDQPTFDAINAFVLSRAIRHAGFTVAVAGTGGDELFGGYSSFRDLPVLHRFARATRWLPRKVLTAGASVAAAALRSPSQGGIPPQTRWAKLPDMVERGDDLTALYQFAYALYLPSFQQDLLAPGLAGALEDGLPRAMHARLAQETRGRSPLSTISVLEQRLFLAERLLRDNDVASMAVSLEQRVPLVDQALFEAVDRLPDALRYDPVGKKSILRRVGLKGLDPAIFERPKSGFVLPFDRWIRRGLRDSVDATLRDPALVKAAGLSPDVVGRLWKGFLEGGAGLYWSRIWALYVLVRWCERNGVRL
ncbi:MAG: asparagine synthase (glutamine-hydrolyzing) [Anaeromyxobacteraceae bacterium]